MKQALKFHDCIDMYEKELHKYTKVVNTGFSWCSKCGLLLETYTKIVPKKIVSRQGEILFLRLRTRSCRSFIPVNLRAAEHKHDWKRLSLSQSWCQICGAREIAKRRCVNEKLRVQRTIVLPLRRVARIQILRECCLSDILN